MCVFKVVKQIRPDNSLGAYKKHEETVKASNENEAIQLLRTKLEKDGYEVLNVGIKVEKVLTT